MRVLIIGGTGLISLGIVKHLLQRNADITVFNRGQREAELTSDGQGADTLPTHIRRLVGDRNDAAQLRTAAAEKFDVVIDMVCFTPQQAEGAIAAFADRCQQFIFCSTVCTYGIKVPPHIFIDETFPQEPISEYGRNKLASERLMLSAHSAGKFRTTIIRPSHTYGPGRPLIDNLEPDPVAWDRISRGLPILCAGDGLGLWVSTHRDDCGKAFAYAALNDITYGQSYNATQDYHQTWTDYYHTVAQQLGQEPKLLYMPAAWIARHDPKRFGLLREITAYHGAYTSAKAKRDIPQFRCEIDFASGAKQTLEDTRRRNAWKNSKDDALYQQMIDAAQSTSRASS